MILNPTPSTTQREENLLESLVIPSVLVGAIHGMRVEPVNGQYLL
jgi:hypothetical protein